MNRGSGLRRTTPLQPSKPLRRTPMPLRTAPMDRSTKPLRLHRPGTERRPLVTPEERIARRLVKARSGDVCEIQVSPGVCTGDATDFCHRHRAGQCGEWSASNGMHGCRGCHQWTHLNPAAARVKGWAPKSYDDLGPVLYRGQWVLLHDDGTITHLAHFADCPSWRSTPDDCGCALSRAHRMET